MGPHRRCTIGGLEPIVAVEQILLGDDVMVSGAFRGFPRRIGCVAVHGKQRIVNVGCPIDEGPHGRKVWAMLSPHARKVGAMLSSGFRQLKHGKVPMMRPITRRD
jgi:hypothetical protein